MKIIKNKIGGEKLISIWWFFVIALVFIGIIFGVVLFYGAENDIRDKEAEVLYEKLFVCLVQDNGFLNSNVLKDNFDVFNECGLKNSSFEKGSIFFFKLEVYDENSVLLRENILQGDFSFEKDCVIGKVILINPFSKCFSKTELFLYSNGGDIKKGILKILASSNNHGENFQ